MVTDNDRNMRQGLEGIQPIVMASAPPITVPTSNGIA
jgi:hypothetical protein